MRALLLTDTRDDRPLMAISDPATLLRVADAIAQSLRDWAREAERDWQAGTRPSYEDLLLEGDADA